MPTRVSRTGQAKTGSGDELVVWIILIIAGLLEVVWAAALPNTAGFTRPVPTGIFLIALGASMALLAKAMESIPLGTAYPVWVGIGAVGAALVGLLAYGEPATAPRLIFLSLLIVSIVGLNITS